MYVVVAMILYAYWHFVTIPDMLFLIVGMVIKGIEINPDGKPILRKGKT